VNLGGALDHITAFHGSVALQFLGPTAVSSAGVAGLLPAETPHAAVVVLAPGGWGTSQHSRGCRALTVPHPETGSGEEVMVCVLDSV